MENLKILKVRESAIIPTKGTFGAAGYDLYASLDNDITLFPGKIAKIPCGVAIELPSSDYAAFMFARSGLGIKHGITLSNGVGVIDSDYRGELQAGLIKLSGEPYVIHNGDRIAQLVIMKVENFKFDVVSELGASDRGKNGFGSTGI